MNFLKTNEPETFLNVSAIATVQFLKQTRTQPLLRHIPMEMGEEIIGAKIVTISGSEIQVSSEVARKLKQIVDPVLNQPT